MGRALVTISGALRREVYEMAKSNGSDDGGGMRAPSLKRPEGTDDLTWAIMRSARNEDVPARINLILAGEHDPDPNEAALLLEVVVGAERKAVQEVIKLRTQMAPKMQAASGLVGALGHIRERLFRDATRL